MINFTPEGAGGDFFRVLAPYAPPPPAGALPPLLWGREERVQELLGDRVESLELTRHQDEEAASAREGDELFRHLVPMVAIYASLADQPERAAHSIESFLHLSAAGIEAGPNRESGYRTNTCS